MQTFFSVDSILGEEIIPNGVLTRMFVPKLVQDGFHSSSSCLVLIWACLIGRSWLC